jgi:uncharacterized Zn finger protein (UPF0148 family)
MAEHSFFCVKCRVKRVAHVTSSSVIRGKTLLKSKCPKCGTNMAAFAKKK